MIRYGARLACCLAILVGFFPAGCTNRRDRPSSAEQVGGYAAGWAARLSQRRFDGQPVAALENTLGAAVKDSVRFVWGGTGNQTAYYLLAELVVVKVDLDVVDRVIGEPSVGQVGTWPEARGGYVTEALQFNR